MKKGKQSITFNNVYLKSCSAITGPLEAKGPVGRHIDRSFDDLYCNCDSWEKAEMHLLETAINKSIDKAEIDICDIDYAISGDLMNQNLSSNYVLRNYKIPFLGIYGACSTSVQSLIIGANFIDSDSAKNVLCSTSSHNATAEKQFRYPTEYGSKKPSSATYTVTGAGAAILSESPSTIKITRATTGRIVDAGQNNPFDMGSAMAPAAAETLIQHLKDFNIEPNYYDLILTGDLSTVGSKIFEEIIETEGYTLNNYNDCGLLIYDIYRQNVFSGGSGCACSAVVTYSYVVDELLKGDLNKVLIVATGALLNPIIMQQKETIPSIAHAISLERVN